MKDKKELSYEQAFGKLEGIVEKMGSASVPLEEMISLYEEGMELAGHCEKLLKSYDARLEKVSKQIMLRELESEDIASEGEETEEDDEEVPF